MAASTSVVFNVLLICSFSCFLCSSALNQCSLRVIGFQGAYSHLNGNWIMTGGKSLSDSAGKAIQYVNYNQENSDLSLQYGGPGEQQGLRGWVIFAGGIGTNTSLALCATNECIAANDLSTLGGAMSWVLPAQDGSAKHEEQMSAVSVSCCPHKMNLCHSCDESACSKHKSFLSCLAASAVSCCTAGGFINGDGCKCTDKTFYCLPYAPNIAISV